MKKMIFTILAILLLSSVTNAETIQRTWDTWIPIDSESYAPDEFYPIPENPRSRFLMVVKTAGQTQGIEILDEFQGRSDVMGAISEEQIKIRQSPRPILNQLF